MRKTSRSLPAILALSLLASFAHAADPAPQPPPAVVRVSFRINALLTFLQDCNLPTLRDGFATIKEYFESQDRISRGALSDQPIGLIFYSRGDYQPDSPFYAYTQKSMCIALPLRAGFSTLEKMAQDTASQTPGGPAPKVEGDTITTNDIVLRRTANYALSSDSDVAKQAADEPFKSDYPDDGRLAAFTIDLATVRKRETVLLDTYAKAATAKIHASPAEVRVLAEPILKSCGDAFNAVDTFSASIGHDDKTLRAVAVITPGTIHAPAVAPPRPVFPAATVFQMHIAYPDANAAAWLATRLEASDLDAIATEEKVPVEKLKRLRNFFAGAARLLTAAPAQSIGLTFDQGSPVLLVINQYDHDIHFDQQAHTLADLLNTLAKENGGPPKVDLSTYTSAQKQIGRITYLDNEEPVAYLDYIQTENTVAFTISLHKVDIAAALAAAPTKGTIPGFLTASLDLNAAFSALEAQGLSLPLSTSDKIHKLLDNQSVTFTETNSKDGKSIIAEASVPLQALKNIGAAIAATHAPQ